MSISKIIGIILGVIILILIEWVVGLWLWQVVAVAALGLPSLSAWQFFGLYVLCRIFFGNGINIKTTTNTGGNN